MMDLDSGRVGTRNSAFPAQILPAAHPSKYRVLSPCLCRIIRGFRRRRRRRCRLRLLQYIHPPTSIFFIASIILHYQAKAGQTTARPRQALRFFLSRASRPLMTLVDRASADLSAGQIKETP